MAAEIKNYLVGPMPIQTFLDDFFPTTSLQGLAQLPKFTWGCYNKVVACQAETLAYDPFVSDFFHALF